MRSLTLLLTLLFIAIFTCSCGERAYNLHEREGAYSASLDSFYLDFECDHEYKYLPINDIDTEKRSDLYHYKDCIYADYSFCNYIPELEKHVPVEDSVSDYTVLNFNMQYYHTVYTKCSLCAQSSGTIYYLCKSNDPNCDSSCREEEIFKD